MVTTIRGRPGANGVQYSRSGAPAPVVGLRVSINEALRVLADHPAAVERREAGAYTRPLFSST